MTIYDLTRLINEAPVFEGDPLFKSKKIKSLERGDHYDLCHIEMSNHTGTHIDFPGHVIPRGATSDDYTLQMLMGVGIIIEYSQQAPAAVNQEFILSQDIRYGDIVFFKSSANRPRSVHLDTSAAKALVERGAKIVGVDSLSVDHLDSETIPVHHELLSNGTLIVENLDLDNAPLGRGEITIAPLNISGADGAPARVFLKR